MVTQWAMEAALIGNANDLLFEELTQREALGLVTSLNSSLRPSIHRL